MLSTVHALANESRLSKQHRQGLLLRDLIDKRMLPQAVSYVK